MTVVSALLLLTASWNAQEPNLNVHLICGGDGVQSRTEFGVGQLTTPQGSYTSTQSYRRDTPFSEEVLIELSGDSGRVRIPQTMLPLIRGGDGGWMQLRNISVTPTEITASATINLFNRARLRINRITGIMSMSVLRGRFDGRCEAYDPSQVRRAF